MEEIIGPDYPQVSTVSPQTFMSKNTTDLYMIGSTFGQIL